MEARRSKGGGARAAALAAGLAGFTLGGVSRADAGDGGATARVAWVRGAGADGCPDGEAIAAAVAARLGRDALDPRGRRSVEAVVARESTRWVARIYLRDEHGALRGVRELEDEGTTCDAVATAATMAIAIAVDPDAALRPPPAATPAPTPASLPSATPAPPSTTPRVLAPTTPPSPRASRRALRAPPPPRGRLLLAGTLGWGLLPQLAPGVALSFDLRVAGPIHVAAQATLFPETRLDTADAEYAFGMTSATASACYELGGARARFVAAACLGATAGLHHGVVYDLTPTNPGASPWLGAALRVRGGARIVGPLFVEAGVQAVAALLRYEYFVSGATAETVFAQPPVALGADVGVGVEF